MGTRVSDSFLSSPHPSLPLLRAPGPGPLAGDREKRALRGTSSWPHREPG